MDDMVKAMVQLEWRAFQAVENAGGRAACQDDFTTFRIMRESQFAAWSEALRQSYLADLREAEQEGRNLIAEKYARMMRHTAPEEYAALAPQLAATSSEARALAERIHAVLVAWQKEFTAAFPCLASGGRKVEERMGKPETGAGPATSFAVYLMGELLTYSPETLALFAAYVDELQAGGGNLSLMTMEHMAARYGYRSLQDAEAGCRNNI